MRKIAIANRKGGTGKSTTAVHLAAALALAEYRVLLVDSDPQGQCSRFFDVQPDHGLAEVIEGSVSIEEAIISTTKGEIIPSGVTISTPNGPDLLAGGASLVGTTRLIAREAPYKSPYLLRNALQELEGRYAFVLFDTAPGFNELTINVLFYVDELLIPVSMEALALDGFSSFLREVEDLRESARAELAVKWIVPTFYDGRVRKSAEILEQLRRHFPDKLTLPIPYSVKLSEAPAWKKTVYSYAPRDRGAVSYAKLAEVLI